MNALGLAKRRAQRRHRQGGAAMFIVAMMLSVLASVGIYALAAASSEVRTSGNERQNTQTHYLAELGILGAADQISTSRAQWYLGLMMTQPDTPCLALPNILPSSTPTPAPITLACRRIGLQELSLGWAPNSGPVPYTGTAFDTSKDPGSLGPIPLKGDLFVELTDPAQANAPPRYALNLNFCFIGLTASSNGLTQPLYNGATAATQASYAAEGVEVQRARIIVGPIQCPK
jgi:hypothetical protein